jgi:Txe/YoeB family toxin of Txe-Axe toxin-antitoxin module
MIVPKKEFLDAILQIEDKAGEQSLRDTVKISHPVAKLLLEWIDADEKKHERIISKMVRLIQSSSPSILPYPEKLSRLTSSYPSRRAS